MIRLACFELRKIWGKPSFLFSIAILLTVNLLLLSYLHLPDSETPSLSENKKLVSDLLTLNDEERLDYIIELEQKVDGLRFVRDVLNMQGLSDERGSIFAEEEMNRRPGLFEQYVDLYQQGDYLIYTDTLEKEQALVGEYFSEAMQVASYNEYLQSIQSNRDQLQSISIFSSAEEATFSSRNIEKSANDYVLLLSSGVNWLPAKAVKSAMENIWADMMLILGMFLFVGALIIEEKEKGLFYITRVSKYGRFTSISAKLMALFIHCVLTTSMIYGSNLLFFEATIGLGDLMVKLQSLAPYMESALDMKIIAFIVCSIATKGIVLFALGSLLTAISIFSNKAFIPYLAGVGTIALSWILYHLIPVHSPLNLLKYVNLIGLLKTENLYGRYLNFNIVGYPISRLALSWLMICLFVIIGVVLTVFLFVRSGSMEIKKVGFTLPIPFRPHANLFFYEAYKILITNRTLIVLLLFILLLGGQNLSKEYHLSAQEDYYQTMMLELEGELTAEKEEMIRMEEERYEKAFAKIEAIDQMVDQGEITEDVGETMKQSYYGVISFYPEFKRVFGQYENILNSGGRFVYDTGYLYLFGIIDHGYMINLLFILLALVFGFANIISMEYEKGSWHILKPTTMGKKKIIGRKMVFTLLSAAMLLIIPWICKSIAIHKVYPMNELGSAIQAIPHYHGFSLQLPVWGFIAGTIILQFLFIGTISLLILIISGWRKNHLQSLFFSLLIFILPLLLIMIIF